MQKKWICFRWLATTALIGGLVGGGMAATPAARPPVDRTPGHVSDVLTYTTDRLPSGEDGAPLVQVTLNDGAKATFLLDTGTSACSVTGAMAAKLGLTPQPIAQAAAPLIMDGAQATTVPLTIQIGRFRFPRFPTLVIKESRFQQVLGHPLDGILGVNLLRHFALILEPQNHVLALLTPGKMTAAQVQSWGFRHASALPLTRSSNGTYWASVGLTNGAHTAQENLAIDTGAGTSILSNAAAQSLDLTPVQRRISVPFGNGSFVGDLADVPSVTLGTVPGETSLAKSTLTLRGGAFLYPNRPESSIGSPHVLGMNILSGCSVLLDFPGETLYLQPLQTSP